MAVTHTASLAASNVAPKIVHAGVNAVTDAYTVGAVLSASGSGVALLCKVPVGAVLHGFESYHNAGETATTLNFGLRAGHETSASYSAIAADVVHQATSSQHTKLPQTVAGSEADNERFKYLTASLAAGTGGSSLVIRYTLTYSLDQGQT